MNKSTQYFESIHLLRGVSAFAVLLGHNVGWYKLPGIDQIFAIFKDPGLGHLGVSIFFFISGFVLPLSLAKSYSLRDFPRFMAKRMLRIEPTYLASIILAVTILVVKTRVAPNAIPWQFDANQLIAHFLYLIPFTKYSWYNEVYWTLAIEFQFYLLIALLFPIWNKSPLSSILTALVFSSLFFLGQTIPGIGLFSKAPIFGAGMLAYSAFRFRGQINKFFIFVLAASLIALYEFSTSSFVGVLISVLSLLLVMYWNAPITPFRYMGTISYSLYVTHYPIVFLFNQIARHFLGSEAHPLLYSIFVVNIVICLLVAHFFYTLIEKPTQVLSRKITYKSQLSRS